MEERQRKKRIAIIIGIISGFVLLLCVRGIVMKTVDVRTQLNIFSVIGAVSAFAAIAVLLGLIPATIAKNKGYRFGPWLLYGSLLFLIAFIHSLILKNLNTSNQITTHTSGADELKKYKDLLDNGVISQEEFDAKKKQLLGL